MEKTLNDYFNGRVIPSNVLHAMEIEIPTLNLSEIFSDGFNGERIKKLFELLPLKEIELEMEDAWEGQDDIERALSSGNYIQRIRVMGCREIIKTLPPTTTTVEIHTDHKITAIKNVVGMENIRKIAMIGGRIDMQTLINIMDRTTWLEELDLCGTEITTKQGLCRAAARILNLIATNVNIEGKPVSQEEVRAILYGYPDP